MSNKYTVKYLPFIDIILLLYNLNFPSLLRKKKFESDTDSFCRTWLSFFIFLETNDKFYILVLDRVTEYGH